MGTSDAFLVMGFGASTLELPSWVRDFSVVISRDVVVSELRLILTYSLCNASNRILGKLIHVGHGELHLREFAADTVEAVGARYSKRKERQPKSDFFSQWLKIATGVLGYDESTMRRTLAQVMCADIINDPRAVSQTGMHRLEFWTQVSPKNTPGSNF